MTRSLSEAEAIVLEAVRWFAAQEAERGEENARALQSRNEWLERQLVAHQETIDVLRNKRDTMKQEIKVLELRLKEMDPYIGIIESIKARSIQLLTNKQVEDLRQENQGLQERLDEINDARWERGF